MKLSEQLAAARAKRKALLEKMDAFIRTMEGTPALAATGTTAAIAAVEARALTAEEMAAFDGIRPATLEVDAEIRRLEEAMQHAAATAVDTGSLSSLGIVPGRTTAPQPVALPKGALFGRYALAMIHAKGDLHMAMRIAERWKDTSPEVGGYIERAAVAAGTTTGATWAAPLVNATLLTNEFIEMLMPATVVGQITGKRNIPFNVKIPRMTGGVTAQWVGEGLSKPVGIGAFDQVTHPWAKLAVITVVSEELIRFSNPGVDVVMSENMRDAIAIEYNNQFLNGGAPVTGVKPGGIFNGIPGPNVRNSTGSTVDQITADVNYVLTLQAGNNLPLNSPHWLMSTRTFGYLSTLRTALGTLAFPTLAMSTPTFFGIPVVTSTQIPTNGGVGTNESYIGLVNANEIFWSQDPNVTVDMSREASLQMDSAPATPPTPVQSLWQQNLVGIKAEQFVYWSQRRLVAFSKIDKVTY
jgi:HK97 family phage major capsid protein